MKRVKTLIAPRCQIIKRLSDYDTPEGRAEARRWRAEEVVGGREQLRVAVFMDSEGGDLGANVLEYVIAGPHGSLEAVCREVDRLVKRLSRP